jgi:tryptophan-rich sensory protein
VGLSLLVLAAHAALSTDAEPGLARLPWPEPEWAWGWVWGALYPLTGVAAWLVWRRVDIGIDRKRAALRIWGWQLLLSGLWPAALFGAHSPAAALAVMATLLVAVGLTVRAFLQLQRNAALLLAPYALWLCWAAYMTVGCFWFAAV